MIGLPDGLPEASSSCEYTAAVLKPFGHVVVAPLFLNVQFAVVLYSPRHVAEQPSPLVVLPSSHCSLPATVPSPQTTGTSIVQLAEQPSPFAVLPSSQASPVSSTPSPQTGP